MASKSLAAGPLLAIAITVMVPKGHGEGVGDGDDNQASREDDKRLCRETWQETGTEIMLTQ